MSDAKFGPYNNPGLKTDTSNAGGAGGAYRQAVTSYLDKNYLKARSLLNMIRKKYSGQFDEKKLLELEGKIKSRIGL